MWRVTIEVGVFQPQYRYLLGVYRWQWLANFAAHLELSRYPYRKALIQPIA